MAGTCDGSVAKLYLNGVLVGTNAVDPNYTGTTSGARIGGEACCAGNNFPGLVDEVSIYTRALSDAEVLSIYNAGTDGKCRPAGGAVPYFTDFENGAGAEWWKPGLSTEGLFTTFSGRFGNETQRLLLTNLVAGQSYTLGFSFYAIDSWDGDSSDFLNVAIDGVQVFHESFANYNGEPPNNSQTYPGRPDEGRAEFGFTPGLVDAIYRHLEITFTAASAGATLAFSGQGLSSIGDESWGIDNVRVQPAGAGALIHSTTLPPHGSISSLPIEGFIVAANRPLLPSTATNAGNFSLREAGANGLLGDGDDATLVLVPSLPGEGGHSVLLMPATAPLQPGKYRFATTTGLQDTNGIPVAAFSRDFSIIQPATGSLENTSNDILVNATPLSLTETPAGSRFLTAFAAGTMSPVGNVDYWRFDAEAGDRVTARLECESQGVYPRLYLRNALDGNLTTVGGDYNGLATFQNYTLGSPGTYYLLVWTDNNRSRYLMRLDVSRGPQTESESNDSQGNANQIALAFTAGLSQGNVVGALPAADPGDYFRLGTLNAGNAINVSALFPNGSSLSAGQLILTIELDGNPVALVTNTSGNLNYTVISNGLHYVRAQAANNDLRAQYLLNFAISDGVAPQITGTSLPAENATVATIIDRLSLNFSEDVVATSVTDPASYELRSAGLNGSFGNADDVLYTVANSSYTDGLSASYTVPEGPLQPGRYRFTVTTNLLDRAGNHMTAPFVRNFTVAGVPGYVVENRANASGGGATLLSPTPGTVPDGTFGLLRNVSMSGNPQALAAGRINGDTNLDLVTANWSSDSVTVFTNNGSGTFTAATTVPTGDGAANLLATNFNGDAFLDLAVANYYANTVSILLGDGLGGFTVLTNYSGFSNPYTLIAGDLNTDGKMDLAVPNYGSGTVRVLLGNGDGTFQAPSNYTTGSQAFAVAMGDLNNDTKPDLAVANQGNATVTLLLGAGDGTFTTLTNLSTGSNPRGVVITDITGDNVPDLVLLQSGDNSVGMMRGNGDGTFQPRTDFPTGAANTYYFAFADFNADNRPDIAVAGYGNNVLAVLLNDGAGNLTNRYTYETGGNPLGIVPGDFDGDGRTDLALANYNGNSISIWTGNARSPLSEDPPGSGLRSAFGRGNISNTSDIDYWKFSGNAGDLVSLAVEIPGNPDASGLHYEIQRMDGGSLTSFNASYNGWGQSVTLTLPQDGTYLVRVSYYYDYQAEYRFRVTLLRPPTQMESEDNNSIANADAVSLTLSNAHQVATMAGYISVGDSSGDYYNLGNLSGGTTVTLGFREPSTSGFSEVLWIYNAAGLLMTNSLAGPTNFVFTVPLDAPDNYYVRLTAAGGGFTAGSGVALRFDGNDDYADVGSWFGLQAFTLSMWVNPEASQTTYADILDNNHQSGVNWVIQQDGNNVNRYFWGHRTEVRVCHFRWRRMSGNTSQSRGMPPT